MYTYADLIKSGEMSSIEFTFQDTESDYNDAYEEDEDDPSMEYIEIKICRSFHLSKAGDMSCEPFFKLFGHLDEVKEIRRRLILDDWKYDQYDDKYYTNLHKKSYRNEIKVELDMYSEWLEYILEFLTTGQVNLYGYCPEYKMKIRHALRNLPILIVDLEIREIRS